EPADEEKNDNHEDLDDSGRLTFWAKQLFQESADTIGLNCPDKPHHEKYGRHCGRHVQVRVATSEQRPIDMEMSRPVVVTPADCSDSRNQSKPVYETDKNENRGIKPKSLLHEVAADDVFQKIVQPLDQPLPKILPEAWNCLAIAHSGLRKNDDASGYDPGYQHRVRHSEAAELNKHLRLQRNYFVLRLPSFSGHCRHCNSKPANHRQDQKTTIAHFYKHSCSRHR